MTGRRVRPQAARRTNGPVALGAWLLVVGLLGGCSLGPPPATPPSTPGPGATATAPAGSYASPVPGGADGARPSPAEPTTTNTLPAPPDPTGPAPSTAGDLDAGELPVPAGWRTVALPGGEEEAFEGNGTWVHARDARYAAQDVITIGCADVTRDDYPDPVAALEGNYEDADGEPGVGLVLEFPDADAATRYWARYTDQVQACQTLTDPVRTELVDLGSPAGDSLLDRRTYPDGEWTEVAARRGSRITLVILSDQGHRFSPAQGRRLLEQLR